MIEKGDMVYVGHSQNQLGDKEKREYIGRSYMPAGYACWTRNTHEVYIWKMVEEIPKEPEIIPFDQYDVLIGKTVKHKDTESLFLITAQRNHGVTIGSTGYNYQYLLDHYTTMFNEPMGKIKE